MEWLASLISAIRTAGPILYLAAFIGSATLLFLPFPIISQLGLGEFQNTYRTQGGVVFVVSASLLLAHIAHAIWQFALSPLRDWQYRRETYKMLAELTEAEKDFMRPFIVDDQNTVHASINDGIAGGLVAKRLIYRASNIAVHMTFPYNLQPGARRILNAHLACTRFR